MLISGNKRPLLLSDEAGNEPFGHAPIVLPRTFNFAFLKLTDSESSLKEISDASTHQIFSKHGQREKLTSLKVTFSLEKFNLSASPQKLFSSTKKERDFVDLIQIFQL